MIKLVFLCYLMLCSCSYYNGIKNSLIFQQESQKKAWIYFYQGLEKKRLCLWEEALESFHTAAALDAESPRIHAHLADCFASLNLKEKALNSLQQAEKYINQNDYMLFFDIGKVYEKLQDQENAKKMYQKALILFPKFQKARESLEFSNEDARKSKKEL
ncbi:MAG: hypothetical protein HUU50_21065 [Candidatus Brocadiae bacterium]|nr:hypothetical protein [Candidatus Brocadiia bacterium]